MESKFGKCYFGVSYLDAAFKGIHNNDLILIGAESGAGKTELCSIIAKVNSRIGKRVCYIALEAEKEEIESRILFSEVCKEWYKTNTLKLLYDDFCDKAYGSSMDLLQEKVKARLDMELNTLNVFYRETEQFSELELQYYIESTYKDTDLYIIDHLHYFDINHQKNENEAYKSLMKKIRDIVLLYNKPVVLIAHLRKKEKGENYIVPILDNFHGSSDIYKIATKVITMKRAEIEGIDIPNNSYPTLFYTAKNRRLGVTTRTVGLQLFDITNNSYKDEVYIAELLSGGSKIKFYKNDKELPIWCQRRLLNEFRGV